MLGDGLAETKVRSELSTKPKKWAKGSLLPREAGGAIMPRPSNTTSTETLEVSIAHTISSFTHDASAAGTSASAASTVSVPPEVVRVIRKRKLSAPFSDSCSRAASNNASTAFLSAVDSVLLSISPRLRIRLAPAEAGEATQLLNA